MKRLLRLAARLYPRTWRDRYGEELEALIDDMTPRWRNLFDIARGAFIMQISRLALVPVAIAAAGAIAGAAVSLALSPVYVSSSQIVVRVPDTSVDGNERARRVLAGIEASLRETTFDKQAVYVTLHSEPGVEPAVVDVSASADSARAAQQLTNRVLGSIIRANLVVSERAVERPGVQFQVVSPAALPAGPERNVARNTVAGGGLGLLLGSVAALVAYLRSRPADGASA
jgi:capsular polysaccharide biosynthesis protein